MLPLNEVDPADADVAFFLYDLVLNPAQNRHALTLHKTVYMKQSTDSAGAKAEEPRE